MDMGKWSRKQQSPLGKSDEEGRVTIIILMVVFMGCLSLLSMGLLLIWEKVAQILAELGSVYFSLVSVELGFWEIYYSIEKRGKKESQHRFIFYYVFIPLDYFVTCSYYLSGHSKKRRVDSLGTLGLMNPN